MAFIINNHPCWDDFLKRNDIQNELKEIEIKIGQDYFPKKENIFRFMENDIKNIKYIIVGMEPYPSSFEYNGEIIPEATGRSFEVGSLRTKTWGDKFKQSSLRNILKTIYYNETNTLIDLQTLRDKISNKEFQISNPSDWFDNTEKQGVLWLNATLTVKPNMVDTHRIYWNYFMTELFKYINQINPNVIWVLWGNAAQERVLSIIPKDNCICSVHPRLASFVNANCFKQLDQVNWCC